MAPVGTHKRSQRHAVSEGGTRNRHWPLLLIAAPAAVAIWSGWVGLGGMSGFGVIHPLPGIWDSARLNTAITLPVGVEAYGAFALYTWLSGTGSQRTRAFARNSAIGALVLGALGQVAFHLLVAYNRSRAPWLVVVAVACLPVVTLAFAASLVHLLRADAEPANAMPAGRDTSEAIPAEAQVPVALTPEATVALPAEAEAIPEAPAASVAASARNAWDAVTDAAMEAARDNPDDDAAQVVSAYATEWNGPPGWILPGIVTEEFGKAGDGVALYRFFDCDGELLYVGITGNFSQRWQDHASSKPWYGSINRMTVVWYKDAAAAVEAETEAIDSELPRYNVAKNPAAIPVARPRRSGRPSSGWPARPTPGSPSAARGYPPASSRVGRG